MTFDLSRNRFGTSHEAAPAERLLGRCRACGGQTAMKERTTCGKCFQKRRYTPRKAKKAGCPDCGRNDGTHASRCSPLSAENHGEDVIYSPPSSRRPIARRAGYAALLPVVEVEARRPAARFFAVTREDAVTARLFETLPSPGSDTSVATTAKINVALPLPASPPPPSRRFPWQFLLEVLLIFTFLELVSSLPGAFAAGEPGTITVNTSFLVRVLTHWLGLYIALVFLSSTPTAFGFEKQPAIVGAIGPPILSASLTSIIAACKAAYDYSNGKTVAFVPPPGPPPHEYPSSAITGKPMEFMKDITWEQFINLNEEDEGEWKKWRANNFSYPPVPKKLGPSETLSRKLGNQLLRHFARFVNASAHRTATAVNQLHYARMQLENVKIELEKYAILRNKSQVFRNALDMVLPPGWRKANHTATADALAAVLRSTILEKGSSRYYHFGDLLDSFSEKFPDFRRPSSDDPKEAEKAMLKFLDKLPTAASYRDLEARLESALLANQLEGRSSSIKTWKDPFYAVCFDDKCNWTLWRRNTLLWLKDNTARLGTPSAALSWFSRLLSGETHSLIVEEIPNILSEPHTILSAVEAAMTILDPFFADPDSREKAVKAFWKVRQGSRSFGDFFLSFRAHLTPTVKEDVSVTEQRRAFLSALRPGLKGSLTTHFLARDISEPTIEQMSKVAPQLDRICADTQCVPNSCPIGVDNFVCPAGKGDACVCKPRPAPPPRQTTSSAACTCPPHWAGHAKKCPQYGTFKHQTLNPSATPYTPSSKLTTKKLIRSLTVVIGDNFNINALSSTMVTRRISGSCLQHELHRTPETVFCQILKTMKTLSANSRVDPSDSVRASWCTARTLCPDCLHPTHGLNTPQYQAYANEVLAAAVAGHGGGQ